MPLTHVSGIFLRCVAELNHCDRFCRPAPNRSANAPYSQKLGIANLHQFPLITNHIQFNNFTIFSKIIQTVMKKVFFFTLAALIVCSCGTSNRASTSVKDSNHEELIDIGYGKIRKKDSNSSVSQVSVPRNTSYSNIYDYIKGQFAGVFVSGTKIRIRGENSVYGPSDPLILVDGVETSDISGILPSMVESISVLRDAASASIYGVQGANGVILITTRK